MIFNIVDRRTRLFRWRTVNAIVEATSHDNTVADSDQMEAGDDDVVYDAREGISIAEAVAWAQSFPGPVTLFLYDEGKGTTPEISH
jgi:hypothetical protein